jgi:hypothetical protein
MFSGYGTPCGEGGDNGLFCDGVEICDGSGACVLSPTGNPCSYLPCNNSCIEDEKRCNDECIGTDKQPFALNRILQIFLLVNKFFMANIKIFLPNTQIKHVEQHSRVVKKMIHGLEL